MIKLIARIISPLALVVLVVPPLLFLADRMELDQVKLLMSIATVAWFVTATLWMGNSKPKTQNDK